MSIPAWQHKLEEVEFKLQGKPDLIINWLLVSPMAKEIPEHVLKARLAKYGYKEPEPVEEQPTTQQRKPYKARAKRSRKDAE
jgi:hypothetical protein